MKPRTTMVLYGCAVLLLSGHVANADNGEKQSGVEERGIAPQLPVRPPVMSPARMASQQVMNAFRSALVQPAVRAAVQADLQRQASATPPIAFVNGYWVSVIDVSSIYALPPVRAPLALVVSPAAFAEEPIAQVEERGVPNIATPQLPSPLNALSLGLQTVTGGAPVTAFITLNLPAPAAGVRISLSSNNPNVAIVPAFVTVPPGMSVTSFTIDTFPVNTNPNVIPTGPNAVITASAGASTKQAGLTVVTPMVSSLALSTASITGGHQVTGTVTLTGPVPSGGVSVHLSSNNPSAGPVPATVQITTGKTGTFQFTPNPVPDNTSIDITANRSTFDGQTVKLTVWRPVLASVKVTPPQVVGCSDTTLYVTMTGKMPTGVDAQIQMTSNSPLVDVPSTVVVASGTDWSGTLVHTKPSTSAFTAKITGHYQDTTGPGLKPFQESALDPPSAMLTVQPLLPQNVSLNPANVVGGNSSTGNVALNGPACQEGFNVGLSSSNQTIAQVPSYTHVDPGQSKSQSFAVSTKPVSNTTQVDIDAFFGAAVVKSKLGVYSPQLADLYIYNVSYLDGSGSPINQPQAGQPFKLCPNIVNGGSAKANASTLLVQMFRSGDPNNPTNWEQSVPELNPSTGASPCIDVPSLGSGQTYDFNLYADYYNVVNESNKANNNQSRSFPF